MKTENISLELNIVEINFSFSIYGSMQQFGGGYVTVHELYLFIEAYLQVSTKSNLGCK